jgi:hypothetical protein
MTITTTPPEAGTEQHTRNVQAARYLPAEAEQLYALVQDGNGGQPLECWPRTAEGAITAINRAAHMSLRGEPVTVYRPGGGLLARFVGGCREGRTRPLRAPVAAI